MKVKILLSFAVLSLLLAGCGKDEKIIPTDFPEHTYSVPQGNNDYDTRIVKWFEDCGIIILYDYTDADIYWSVTKWLQAKQLSATSWSTGILTARAAPDWINGQLDLLEKNFLNLYSADALHKYAPLRLFLCGELFSVTTTAGAKTVKPSDIGYKSLIVNYGSEAVQALTQAKKLEFKNSINSNFIKWATDQSLIPLSTEFLAVSDYATAVTNATMYERGLLKNVLSNTNDYETYFNAILSYSYEELTMETAAGNYTMYGILNPIKDTKGLIRKKYDMMIAHFEKYGIDLQAVGNYKPL